MGNSTSSPLVPSADPWYSAPAGFESALPGAILKVRETPGIVASVRNSSAAYQYLYRTTDSRYQPAWAVTTLLVPITPAKEPSLLSYQIPYDSASVDASPSYTLYSGAAPFGDADISGALGRGWYVTSPDYEGPKASFTAGVTSGHATLDSIRAVTSTANTYAKLCTAKKALWGYSGGALASEWALELQNQYAPELSFIGAALGGLTPNVSSVLYTINKTVYAGLAVSGILGLSSQFPDAETYLQSQLKPNDLIYSAKNFNAARNYSLIQSTVSYAGQDVGQYFQAGFDALLTPIPQRIIRTDGLMGYHGVPQAPLFVYKAIADDISVVADTDKLINRYCEVGATIDYQRNTVGSHASELINGNARAYAFLDKIFAGTYTATGCSITNVTVGV